MSRPTFQQFAKVAAEHGINLHRDVKHLAMDADPQPQLHANGGIPAIVSTFIDPTIVQTLFTPNRAIDIIGREEKKGVWGQESFMIQRVEQTGDTVAYDDYSNDGAVQVNVNWEQRDAYRFHTMVTYGELEQERYGLAMLSYAAEKQRAAINVINQDANKFYFYGVSGLRNYGLLNDPALPAAITPLTVNGKVKWADKAIVDKYNDILALYSQVVKQTNGIVGDGVDMSSRLVLVMSNTLSVYLKSSNEIFATSLEDMLKKAFPNMRIETAPQYSTDAGELIQMFVEEAQGQTFGFGAYSEKLRTHQLVPDVSSYRQKYSASPYGAVITAPMFIAQMLGA